MRPTATGSRTATGGCPPTGSPPSRPRRAPWWSSGGFDSYIEELFAITDALCTAGWDVVAFEGPGQGGALEEAGLPFEVEWEHPVAAVLDHYALSDVSVLGISLGGGLAVRAAAFEPRVRRLICDDILFDFLDVSLHQLPAVPRAALTGLLRAGADRAVNTLVHRAMRRSPVLDWGLHQGMHVFGVDTRPTSSPPPPGSVPTSAHRGSPPTPCCWPAPRTTTSRCGSSINRWRR